MNIGQFGRGCIGVVAFVISAMIGVPSASGACFESGVDCTDDHDIPYAVLQQLSCDALWTVRNTIFDENGYCFRSARARAVFSNDGCQYTSMSTMPLNAYETANIATIRRVESEKGCN